MNLPRRPAPPLQERRAAYWQAREQGREAEAVTLWSAYLLWQLVPGNLTLPPSAFLAFMCEGHEESPGTLYNTLDRGRALSLGYAGSLTRLAQVGRALRTGIPRAEVDALSPAELAARLRVQRLSESESAARTLAPLRERTRDLLREADPTAHSRPLAVGQDAAALARLLAYLAAEHARYEAWIRGETAPQEAPND